MPKGVTEGLQLSVEMGEHFPAPGGPPQDSGSRTSHVYLGTSITLYCSILLYTSVSDIGCYACR